MKTFINEDFLLLNPTAVRLYHEYAKVHPLIDFHCHLSPAKIAENYNFTDPGEAWLEGDHYKWRAMRANGVDEYYCTGKASYREKFRKWAETVPYTIGNPLFHWTHLELARYFGIYELLSPSTADRIYNVASSMLQSAEFGTQSLITKMNVEAICTTDDPVDPLDYHRQLKKTFPVHVLPAFRPDNLLKTDDPVKFRDYTGKLGAASGTEINSFSTLCEAVEKRHEFFHKNGCRLSDNGIESFFFSPCTISETDRILGKLLKAESISQEESEKFKTAMLVELCRMNHKRGWTQQFHAGALRNNNSRMFRMMGPDTGWDSVGSVLNVKKMSLFLNALDETDQLARTILYNLNPSDNATVITMTGNFNDGSHRGKVRYGAAWWFLDQKNGMEKHLRDLSSYGLLSSFAGMVTDSRSFLSYPRHEYFRRLLCNYLGEEVEKGLIPDDDGLIKPLIDAMVYKNAKEYIQGDNQIS